jgi:Fe-S cluster assembly ATP-binding protein
MKKLLEIKNIHTKVKDLDKQILKGLDLTVNYGEIHVIMGPNGAGKSTLANTIFNNPEYEKTEGSIKFDGKDITNEKVNNIAKAGVFMSFQTPEEIPGITVAQFLKSAKQNVSNEKLNLYNFSKEVEDYMNKLSIPTKNTTRDLNVGFSGGEKKKNEILQMLVLNPKLAILDETDSGLDVDAINIVSNGINLFKNDNNSVIIITHSTKLLKNLDVDYVHVLVDGKIVLSGDHTLANRIDKEGY